MLLRVRKNVGLGRSGYLFGSISKFVTRGGGGLKPWTNVILLEPSWHGYSQLGDF